MHIPVEQDFLDSDRCAMNGAALLAQQKRLGCGCLQDAQVPADLFIDDVEILTIPLQYEGFQALIAGDIIRHKNFSRAVAVDVGRVHMDDAVEGFVAEGFDFLKGLVPYR